MRQLIKKQDIWRRRGGTDAPPPAPDDDGAAFEAKLRRLVEIHKSELARSRGSGEAGISPRK